MVLWSKFVLQRARCQHLPLCRHFIRDLFHAGSLSTFEISTSVAFSASLTATPPMPRKPPSLAASATCWLCGARVLGQVFRVARVDARNSPPFGCLQRFRAQTAQLRLDAMRGL
jgi:hypothetical protein